MCSAIKLLKSNNDLVNLLRVLNENTIFLQQGTVKLVFQPGEEGYAGAYEMLKDEILDDLDGILLSLIHI